MSAPPRRTEDSRSELHPSREFADVRSIRSMSAVERVAEVLRNQIVDGRLRSGTRLTEETLTGTLGVSRNTVREAFALLRAERIVVHERNRGVFVATPTVADVHDLYAARRVIEPAAIRRARPDQARELRTLVVLGRAAAAADDWDEVASINQRFHRTIVGFAESRRLSETFEGLLAEMRLVFHRRGELRFHAHYLDLNDQICALVETGRSDDAARSLTAYLDAAEAELAGALRP